MPFNVNGLLLLLAIIRFEVARSAGFTLSFIGMKQEHHFVSNMANIAIT